MKKFLVMLLVGSTLATNVNAAILKIDCTKIKQPVVDLKTSMGDIFVQLNKKDAPISVKNFLRYVNSGFYAGTIFHRVIPGFMIQGGGFTPNLQQKATKPPIKNEAANMLKNAKYTIAMARTNDPNSATSQFFINVADNTSLDYTGSSNPGYAVFGKVISGQDVVDNITGAQTTTVGPYENVPQTAVVIKSATQICK
jgi:peptidyl-prolyl cis-trans isomerase A (cyclophilin A)